MAPPESYRAALSFPSGNAKTGPIAVSSTSRLTCPSSCSLACDQGCYAEAGYRTRLHCDRLSVGRLGITAAALIQQVAALPVGGMFRHCVAGDQWPDPLRIDQALLLQLACSVAAGLQRQSIPAVCVVPLDAPSVLRHGGCSAAPAGAAGGTALCSGRAFGSVPKAMTDRASLVILRQRTKQRPSQDVNQ